MLPMVAIGLAILGSQASAVEKAVGDSLLFTHTSHEFSGLRDPRSFANDLDVLLPRATIPLSRADAIAHELRYRSESMSDDQVLATAQAIAQEAAALHYDPLLFLALIRVESNFNHLATSPVGAEGLMQLMPATANWMATKNGVEWPDHHSFDPVLNVRLGSRYLGHLTRQFRGRLDMALTAYNRGPSATRFIVKRYGRLPSNIKDFYATKVLKNYRTLRRTYGHLPRGI